MHIDFAQDENQKRRNPKLPQADKKYFTIEKIFHSDLDQRLGSQQTSIQEKKSWIPTIFSQQILLEIPARQNPQEMNCFFPRELQHLFPTDPFGAIFSKEAILQGNAKFFKYLKLDSKKIIGRYIKKTTFHLFLRMARKKNALSLLRRRSRKSFASSTWEVYMIEAKSGKLYTGITNNLERRFREHQKKQKGARFFHFSSPERVVFRKACPNRSEATRKESAIKKMSRSEKLRLINSANKKKARSVHG